jgi:hypothetical protein
VRVRIRVRVRAGFGIRFGVKIRALVWGQVRVRIRVKVLARYPFGAISLEGEPRQGRVGRNNVKIIPWFEKDVGMGYVTPLRRKANPIPNHNPIP